MHLSDNLQRHRPSALALSIFLGAYGCGSSGSSGAPASPPPTSAREGQVTVDLAAAPGAAKLQQGFLHGVASSDLSAEALARIDALAPGFWRLSNIFDGAAYRLVTTNHYPALHGTRIQWVLQDVFATTYGNPVVVNPGCNPAVGPTCIRSFDELKSAWTAFMDDLMNAIAADDVVVDDFDIFNEPEMTFRGIDTAQLFELLKIAHDTIRSYRPDARIVAPSTSKVAADGFAALFEYAVANELRLDAVSWHEFDRPAAVAGNVASVRRALDTAYAARPDLKPSHIHINEYAPPQSHLIPGWTVSWLAEFERAEVDAVARACWTLAPGWSDCERGLNGLLLQDQSTPQPLYWVHWAYAHMPATRRQPVSVSDGLAAIASQDAATGRVTLLVGRESCGMTGRYCIGADLPAASDAEPAFDVHLSLTGYESSTSVVVSGLRIPGASQPTALATPDELPIETVPVIDGRIEVLLPAFEDGGAFVVKLDPAP